MLRKLLSFVLILELAYFGLAKQQNYFFSDEETKKSNEMPKKLGGVFTDINSVKSEAQKAAEDIVEDFEQMKMFVLDSAEQVGNNMVNKIGNSNIEISKSKRDLNEAVSNLKNQTVSLGSKIGSIGNVANLPDNLTKMLGGIFGNINVILDKLTNKLKSGASKLSDEPVIVFNSEVTEIVDDIVKRKRDLEKGRLNLDKIFQNVNRIIEKITLKIEKAIDNSLEKDKKLIESKKRALAKFYKNKYSAVKRSANDANKTSIGSINERYAKAGAEYSNQMQELAIEFMNSLAEAWNDEESEKTSNED